MSFTQQEYYAGIGSRKTPESILLVMEDLANQFQNKGYILRSGGAAGADTAFEKGADPHMQIFIPWNGFSGRRLIYRIPEKAFEIASRYHPAWPYLKDPVRALMARNVMQVLGPNLDMPSEFVICWTPDGCYTHQKRTKETGGTGLAISVASENGIPVFNLQDSKHFDFVTKVLVKRSTEE